MEKQGEKPSFLLASGQGDAYQYGELRMALRVMIKLVDEAEDLTWNSEIGRVKGLHPIIQRVNFHRCPPGKSFGAG